MRQESQERLSCSGDLKSKLSSWREDEDGGLRCWGEGGKGDEGLEGGDEESKSLSSSSLSLSEDISTSENSRKSLGLD